MAVFPDMQNVKVPRAEYQMLKDLAKRKGMFLTALFAEAIREYVKRDKGAAHEAVDTGTDLAGGVRRSGGTGGRKGKNLQTD